MKKLPLVENADSQYPKRRPVCPVCKNQRIFEPNSFAVLEGGALLADSHGGFSGPSEKMIGFLHILWHGAHDGGTGPHQGLFEVVPAADNVKGGQFSIYFCSPKCLRFFLNNWVDQLEQALAESDSESRT